MAVKVIGWVWDCSQAKGAERLVLLAIADCANASGYDAWPSMTELCRKTLLSERGVQKAIRRLEEMGELKVTALGGRGRTNRYQVLMETPNVVQDFEPAKPRTSDGVSGQTNPEQSSGFSKPRTSDGVSGAELAGQPENGDVQRSTETPNLVRETPNHVHPEPSVTVNTTNSYGVGAADATRDAPTAQTLVGEWIDHCNKRPPGRVIGQVSKEIGLLLREDIAYADVRAGVAAWHQKGLHPSTLASVVHEVMNSPSTAAVQKPKPSTTDQRVAQAQALKVKYRDQSTTVIRGEIAR